MSSRSLPIVALALFVACAPAPREAAPLEIETVEVGDPVDVELSTERDEKGTAPPDADGWILTGLLPEDLPLHRPARLVDSGESAEGRRYFVFHTSTGVEAVRTGLERSLVEAGWSAEPGAGGLTASKGEKTVDFSFSPLRPGTEIKVEY